MDPDRREAGRNPHSLPSSSSSDDDENKILISEMPSNNHHSRRALPSSSFEVTDATTFRVARGFCQNRKFLLLLLFAICIPSVFFVVYLFSDSDSGAYTAPLAFRPDPTADRMREAELKALHLLRNQKSGLMKLWNATIDMTFSPSASKGFSFPPPASNFSSNSSASGNSTVGHEQRSLRSDSNARMSFEKFRMGLREQIRLNTEIQKLLLSTHNVDNTTSSSEDNVDDLLSSDGVDACRKVERPTNTRTIEWKPKKDRYLFAICVSGQMSNHLICLEKHMLFAALLNRVLVLGSPKFDYQYGRVIDIDHVNGCFGRKVVMTFKEFAEVKKNEMRIDRFVCYMADPPCYVDEEHAKKLKALGISLAQIEAAWPKSVELDKRVASDITTKFGCNDEVLAVGDLFYANVEEEWVNQPGGPLAHNCKTVIQPSRKIIVTAERFIQTFLGGNFIALHFRRHGFLKFCNAKEESCFFPIPQAAECILRVVEKANAPVIYLSTDAADSEIHILQSLMVANDKRIPLIKRPGHNPVEKWDSLLSRNNLEGDNQVEAMLDKVLCALSSVFIGAPGSTFTGDILRLRKDWGTASVCDEYLCIGERPNFIASDE